MGPIYSLSDFLDMVRRRIWLILAVTVIGCAFSVMVALSRPHEYQSSQVIQIAQPVIVDELARTTVGGSSARRLQLIEQRLMARDSVLEVIDRYDLYSDLTGIPLSRKVNLLRSSILIEGVAAAREGFSDDGTISVITISARMGTPELAQKLAREFGDRTIELSSRERIEQAQKTLEFFDGQSEALASEISALEEQIADYQRTNDLSLPGSLEFRRDEIAAINNTLLDIARDRIEIERAMELLDGTERPATAQRKREDYEDQLATLDAQRKLLVERKTELEQLLESSPQVKKQLGAYERQLEQLQVEANQVAQSRTEAELGLKLEADRQAERLTVLEEPALPDFPVSRSRKSLAMLGGIASVALGFVLAFLMELRNPVIRSAAQMERELGITPAVSVPYLDARRRRSWFGGRKRTSSQA